jgi:cytochrome c oxidase cbb3-type subunit 1
MVPYYVLRALGGALFLSGALLMAFNVTMTILGRQRDEAPIFGATPALKAAE